MTKITIDNSEFWRICQYHRRGGFEAGVAVTTSVVVFVVLIWWLI